MSTEKKEKRILLVGRSGCGKTTLADTITHGSATYHKTQAITRVGNFIDTPGEYMENPNYYRGIILHAYDADIVIFMIPAGDHSKKLRSMGTIFQKDVSCLARNSA